MTKDFSSLPKFEDVHVNPLYEPAIREGVSLPESTDIGSSITISKNTANLKSGASEQKSLNPFKGIGRALLALEPRVGFSTVLGHISGKGVTDTANKFINTNILENSKGNVDYPEGENKFCQIVGDCISSIGTNPASAEKASSEVVNPPENPETSQTSGPKQQSGESEPLLALHTPDIIKLRSKVRAGRQSLPPEDRDLSLNDLCKKHRVTPEDIKKEALLYGGSEEKAQLKMVLRLTRYYQAGFDTENRPTPSLAARQEATNYDLPTIKAIEKAFKIAVLEQNNTEINVGSEGFTDDFNITISQKIEGKGRVVIIEEKYINEGSFKTASLASDYFAMKEPAARKQYVSLELKSGATAPDHIKEEYNKEIGIIKELSANENIKNHIPNTHIVINLANGTQKIIQEAAGIKLANGTVATEFQDLAKMYTFTKRKETLEKMPDSHQRTCDLEALRTEFDDEMGMKVGYGDQVEEIETIKDINEYNKRMDELNAECDNTYSLTPQEQLGTMIAFKQILTGMDAIHKEGYLHRDLKNENALLYADGAKVTDFGFLTKNNTGNELNRTVGTPPFMSPEICNREVGQPITAKTDVWSMAMMAYQTFVKADSNDPIVLAEHPTTANAMEGIDVVRNNVLLGTLTEEIQTEYKESYPEPEEKASFEYFAWRGTQLHPDERADVPELIEIIDTIINKFATEHNLTIE